MNGIWIFLWAIDSMRYRRKGERHQHKHSMAVLMKCESDDGVWSQLDFALRCGIVIFHLRPEEHQNRESNSRRRSMYYFLTEFDIISKSVRLEHLQQFYKIVKEQIWLCTLSIYCISECNSKTQSPFLGRRILRYPFILTAEEFRCVCSWTIWQKKNGYRMSNGRRCTRYWNTFRIVLVRQLSSFVCTL